MKKLPVLWFVVVFLVASCVRPPSAISYTPLAPVPEETAIQFAQSNITASPTWPPPLPTPTPVWVATQTPAASELSGYIVFHDWPYPYTSPQIFIEDLATREIKQLTDSGSNGSPAWSPDGRKIAFSTRRDGLHDIYIMNRDGSNQTRLTQCKGKDIGFPAWSPDGLKIAFSGDCDQEGSEAIYIVDVITHQVTRLTEYGSYLHASWSSNGERIAYVIERQQNGYIHIMNLDGSEDHEVVSTAARPVWCPDDTCLVYQAGYGKGYVGKLMILDLKTKAAKELLSPPYAAPKGVDEFLSARSPIRGYITFSVRQNLYAMDVKNNRVYFLGLQSYSGSLYP